MPNVNIRVMYENQADETSSLTADTTAGTLVAANLLTDVKTQVHRSTALTVQYDLQWAATVTLNMVALPFVNYTAEATMRVRGYTEVADVVAAVDTGAELCCAYQPLGIWAWGMLPLGVNAFRYGGGTYARSFFAATPVKKILIDISDPGNSAGYLEAARVVTGAYWEPETNPEYGAELSYKYGSQHVESEAGDLRTERRPKRRGMSFSLPWISTEADRLAMHEILLGNGLDHPIFISLFPEHSDPVLEQQFQMWAKLTGDTSMSHPKYGMFATPLTLREI